MCPANRKEKPGRFLYIYYIYRYRYIYIDIFIYSPMKDSVFEVATESWPEWDLNPGPVNSV